MSINIKYEGVTISAARDGAMFNTFAKNQDYIISDIGDELEVEYSSNSFVVSLGTGEAVMCGRSVLSSGDSETLTLTANSNGYLVVEVDLSQTDVCQFASVQTLQSENINANGIIRDLPLYYYTTDDKGVSSITDMRDIKDMAGDAVGETAPCIIIKAPQGSLVSVTKDTTTYEGYTDENNKKPFYLNKRGQWTARFGSLSKVVNVDVNRDYEVDFNGTVMGVSRDISASTPILTRTDASVGKTAVASIGTSTGHSDFDTMPIYKDMEKVTLNTGDVMVKIPKFYYRRYREGNTEYLKICETEKEGFTIHPAFKRNNINYEHVYVGAYKTSSNNKSISGAAPTVSQTRGTMRNNARSKGTNWGIIDIATRNAIAMLISVEFATFNVQEAIGAGYTASGHSGAINTGSCDGVPNLTGRPAGSSDNVDVVWRGIEGLWGNVWEWTDGLNLNNGAYYVTNILETMADDTASGYEQLSFSASTSWNQSYINGMGLDANHPWAMLPNAAGSGSESTYYCDAVWSASGWRVLGCGARWNFAGMAGIWATDMTDASSSTNSSVGSRLLFLPLS